MEEEPVSCSHEHWENGVCLDCGAECTYHLWDNGVCRTCGLACSHEQWKDGVCTTCGFTCPHEHWNDGICLDCGFVCNHEQHYQSSCRCTVCGKLMHHSYDGGVCSCGKTLEFLSVGLPSRFFKENKTCHGTVESVSYTTPDYSGWDPGLTFDKKMNVYLPPDYDESKQYNVLILMHGMYDNENYWLQDPNEYILGSEGFVYSKNVIDNMISDGLCQELIVVSPTFYRDSETMRGYNRYREQAQLMPELRNEILPYIVEHYSTYAETPDTEGISAAREHFAYAGLSMGSIYAYNTVMPDGQDLFAWYGCFSGSECEPKAVAAALNAPDKENYPIRYFYNAAGTKDTMRAQHYKEYTYLITHTDKLSEGENSVFVDHPNVGHEYKGWIMDLYNCLLVFFQ